MPEGLEFYNQLLFSLGFLSSACAPYWPEDMLPWAATFTADYLRNIIPMELYLEAMKATGGQYELLGNCIASHAEKL